jgi:hypothetical protein
MGRVLLVFLVVTALFVVWVNVMAWAGWRWLRRRNEVTPSRPTRPPVAWLVSPALCARLHRRLRDAVAVAQTAVPSPRWRRRSQTAPLVTLAEQLKAHAVTIDHDLIVAARLRGAPAVGLRQTLAAQTYEVEHLAHRLAVTAARGTPSSMSDVQAAQDTLRSMSEQLDALDAAWAEIFRVERDAGLRVPA